MPNFLVYKNASDETPFVTLSLPLSDVTSVKEFFTTVAKASRKFSFKNYGVSHESILKICTISTDDATFVPLEESMIPNLSCSDAVIKIVLPPQVITEKKQPKSNNTAVINDYFSFLDQHRKSQWHCTNHLAKSLLAAGAVEITEDTPFNTLKKDTTYFMRRNEGSCLFAFTVPSNNTGRVVATGAHCDIPAFLMKPTTISQREKYAIIPAEIYGGLLPYSWFNRDLGIAGRVITVDKNGELRHRLVDLPSVATIPTIAPHLNNGAGMEKVAPDMSAERLHPVISLYGANVAKDFTKALVGNEELQTFDLRLYDMQGPALFGLNKEFIHAQGQDDGICCFGLTRGYIDAIKKGVNDISVLCIYDNEEIGSETAYGANSRFFSNLIEKISKGFDVEIKVGESMFFSCDVGHADIHSDKSDQWCAVTHGNGVGIRLNAKQLNVSSAITTSVVKNVAKKNGVSVQIESRRNNIVGGSTISRFIASDSLMRVCDLGVCLTSMHGVREISHVNDLVSICDLSSALYRDSTATMMSIKKD